MSGRKRRLENRLEKYAKIPRMGRLTKLGKIMLGLAFFFGAFEGSVLLRDRLYERQLQTNKSRIKAGMSEAEVIAILGQPTSKHMSDIPGLYWCYGSDTSDSWDYEGVYCGTVGIEMSPGGRVVREPE
jgi:hypothetical protein